MKDKKVDKEQKQIDEQAELTNEEKIQGQLDSLREMNKILKGAMERHETIRSNH